MRSQRERERERPPAFASKSRKGCSKGARLAGSGSRGCVSCTRASGQSSLTRGSRRARQLRVCCLSSCSRASLQTRDDERERQRKVADANTGTRDAANGRNRSLQLKSRSRLLGSPSTSSSQSPVLRNTRSTELTARHSKTEQQPVCVGKTMFTRGKGTHALLESRS